MNRSVFFRLLAVEIVFLGLVVLLVTGVVRGGPLYWAVLAAIVLSAWGGVIAARRLFPRRSEDGRPPSPPPESGCGPS